MSRNWKHIQQQQVAAQRQEVHRQQGLQRANKDRQLRAMLGNEESCEHRRHLQHLQGEVKEMRMESCLLEAEEERINREKQLEQEERMAEELARINLEKQRDEKMRQHIRENSSELRELESKLNCAYVNKERASQIAEHEATKFETMHKEAEFAHKMKTEQQRAAVEQQKLEQRRYEELVQYQKDLEQQLLEEERKRREAKEEVLQEKLVVDETVRKIYEEDQMERQLKLERVRATKQQIEEFKRQQAERRHMEQEKVEAENRRIVEFERQQERMEVTRMAQIREKEEATEHLHKILFEKMEGERQRREEMERVRVEFYFEEREEASRQRDAEEMEKKMRQKQRIQQSQQEQMAVKETQKQAEKEEEEAFRKMMIAKFAMGDRIELMNAQKRRMKQLEHKREVEKLLEDRRRQREAEMELEAKERAMEQEREAQHKRLIEEERQRLLTRHATNLLGHLPKGLLREEDLEHFDEDFRKNFQTRQADLDSDDSWEGDP